MSANENTLQVLTNRESKVDVAVHEPSVQGGIDPEQWVAQYGDDLFRHALAHMADRSTAEDLVQETFLAAWRSRNTFEGRSSEKTWLFGILKHKIAGAYRQRARQVDTADSDALAELEASQFKRSLFGDGHWSRAGAPGRWPDPARSLEQTEFWQVLHGCLDKLPETLRSVFLLRELEECESDSICADLKVSSANLFVLLHRARLALRRCLELNWFKPGIARTRQPKPH